VRTQARKARVMSGLILLALIGILIGFVVARVRKRMGLGVTWGTWVTTVAVVAFLLLLLYATSLRH
jgi:hypothetical protein